MTGPGFEAVTRGLGRDPGRDRETGGGTTRDPALALTTATTGGDATTPARVPAPNRMTAMTAETTDVVVTRPLRGGTIGHGLAPMIAMTGADMIATTTVATALARRHGSVRTHVRGPALHRGVARRHPSVSGSVPALCRRPPSTQPTCTRSRRPTASPTTTGRSHACGPSRAAPSVPATCWRWTRRALRRTSARSGSTRCVPRRASCAGGL